MSGTDSRVPAWSRSHSRAACPAPECLPLAELADCARAAIESDGETVLSYGPGGGYPLLREWIAERHGVEPEQVVLTNGSLQGFQFVAELLAPNGPVLVEAPTYDRPLKILASLDAEVIPVPLDEEVTVGSGAFLYTIPTFQNPTGRTLPLDRRKRLAKLAKGGLLVLEDDPVRARPLRGQGAADACSSSPAARTSSTARPSRRRSRRAFGSATSCCPERSPRQVESAAASAYITPALLSQATVYALPAAREARAEPRAGLRAAPRRGGTR